MRRTLWLCAAVAVLAASGVSGANGQDQNAAAPANGSSAAASAPQQDPLVEAARRAREAKKDAPKAAKVFTNDDIPSQGAVSTVGESPDASQQESGDNSKSGANDEKTWKDKFAALHHKLEQDQAELDVLQREANTGMLQYYGGDPQKAAQDQESQQPLGAAYGKKVSDIDAKKKDVEADQQAISDAEDELRKAGGDPGWAR
jgi:hypothetical protein